MIIRFLDAYVVDVNGNRIDNGSPFGQGNIYPWGAGDDMYSLPPVKVQNWAATGAKPTGTTVDTGSSVASDTEHTFSGVLTDVYSEGTLYLMAGFDSTATVPTGVTAVSVVDGVVQGDVSPVATVDRNGVVQQLNKGVETVIGVVSPKTKQYTITLKTSAATTGAKYVFYLEYKKDVQKNILFNTTGETESSAAGYKNLNTMEFDIKKTTVDTKTRKLGARYSFELMEDYKAEFGENFEDKMVDYLTTTILTEIDAETLQMLSDNAVWTSTWNAQMPMTWTKGLNEWYATIMPEINKLSMTIYERTHVGGASFLVCNPTTAIIFQGMMQYSGNGNPMGEMEIGTVRLGTLSNAYNVYVSPLCPANEIILGFKGSNPEDTGAIYAPYVPVQLQPITYAEGLSAVIARSRYWMGVIRPDYYAKLKIEGLTSASGTQYNPAF